MNFLISAAIFLSSFCAYSQTTSKTSDEDQLIKRLIQETSDEIDPNSRHSRLEKADNQRYAVLARVYGGFGYDAEEYKKAYENQAFFTLDREVISLYRKEFLLGTVCNVGALSSSRIESTAVLFAPKTASIKAANPNTWIVVVKAGEELAAYYPAVVTNKTTASAHGTSYDVYTIKFE